MIGEFSDILGKLYDAAIDTNKWKPFLADLTDLLDSEGAHMIGSVWPEEVLLSVIYGASDAMLEVYAEYLFTAEDDPRPAYALNNPLKPYCWEMLPNLEAFRKSPLYTKVFEPHGIHDQLVVQIPIDQSIYGATHLSMAIWRHRDRGPYSQADCDVLAEFVPHLKRVFELQRLFIMAQFDSNPAVDVLESFPTGIMLCDSSGHVQFANQLARAVADEDDGLTVRHGQIWAESADATERLRGGIRSAVAAYCSDQVIAPTTLSLERPSGKQPLLVMVSSVSRGAESLHSDMPKQPVAVVYVNDPERPNETSEELLQRLFGLTNAEAQLLRSIVAGSSLKDAALSDEITESTARSYLKQIFAKTNTAGQADLIRLVSISPAWLRHQDAGVALRQVKP